MKKKVKAKKVKKAVKPKRKKVVDPNVENEYWETITYKCPVTGKLITQKIKVKKYKSLSQVAKDREKSIVSTTDPLSDFENADDGLSIYSEEDFE